MDAVGRFQVLRTVRRQLVCGRSWVQTHESRLWWLNFHRRKWPIDAALALALVTVGVVVALSGAWLAGVTVAVVVGGSLGTAALVERALPRRPLPPAALPVAMVVIALLVLTAVVLPLSRVGNARATHYRPSMGLPERLVDRQLAKAKGVDEASRIRSVRLVQNLMFVALVLGLCNSALNLLNGTNRPLWSALGILWIALAT